MSKVVTKILDVSKWNDKTALPDFKREGFTGVMIRAGYGKNHIDPTAFIWYARARSLDMDVGFYWFSYATTIAESVQEAKYLLDFAKGKFVTLPLAFDYEKDSLLGKRVKPKDANAFGKMFCSTIEDSNYYAMFYSNKDWYDNVWDADMKEKYDCWYARYQPESVILQDIPNVHLAQYATSYSIKGKVISQDVNYDFIGLADLIKRKGLIGKLDG